MTNTEKKNAIRELLERGKEKGSLTYTEINESLEKLEFTQDQINILYH